MIITINAQGEERKRLVKTISDWLGCPAKYNRAPSFSYEVDHFTIEKNGNLSFDDRADSEVVERLLQHIHDEGFDIDQSHRDSSDDDGFCISLPRSLFTDKSLNNLESLLAVRGALIKKALDVTELPLTVDEAKVSFPWFDRALQSEELKAYESFIRRLCDMAINQHRITAKEKETENEKYTFRCFLIRLGFTGPEFKAERKILLRNLSGSSAYRGGAKTKEPEICS